MDIRLAARVKRIKPSPTLAVTARAAALRAQGKDVIGLGAGEPDFDTPEHIKQAAIDALAAGDTKYTAVDGTPALKQAIIRKFERDNGLKYAPAQVVVSCGGKQSFFNLCAALLDTGDEVIIPAPYWVSYPDIVLLHDGTPVIVDAGIEQGFKMTPAQLDAAITKRTRLVVLNSPSNPTGVAYRRAELAALGEVLRKHPQVLIATDDMYEHILWADEPFSNIAMACPDLVERTIVLNGVSKAYAMTGWRIGYAAGPEPLMRAMAKVQSQTTSNPTSIAQAAAVAALDGDQDCIVEMRASFQQRHAFVLESLEALPGIRCAPADGTFYLLPDCREFIASRDDLADDIALAELLLAAGVAVVPGSAFGAPGYLRISFATSNALLAEALLRIERVVTERG